MTRRRISVWWDDRERFWVVDNGVEKARVEAHLMGVEQIEPAEYARRELKLTMELWIKERKECGCAQCLEELA